MFNFKKFIKEKETFNVDIKDYRKSAIRKILTKIITDKGGYVKQYNDDSVTFEVDKDSIRKSLMNLLSAKGINVTA